MTLICDTRMQFRAWRFGQRDELLKVALLEPYKPKVLNQELLCLLARELNPNRRDTRYKAPFSVPENRKSFSPEEGADDVQLL